MASTVASQSEVEGSDMADDGSVPVQQAWPMTVGVTLSPLYDQALNFARVLHNAQRRKSNGAPYLSHLLEVSGLVLEYGGDEAQAIAALLHDAIEDQATAFGGAELLRDIIAQKFGPTVLPLVELCSDCEGHPKPAWIWRKQRHLVRLSQASAADCLVPACDKLHNLRCLNAELRAGSAPFRNLKAGPAQYLQHFTALLELFEQRGLAVAAEIRHELGELRRLLSQRRFGDEQPADCGYARCAMR
ncbi:MAG: bifunctional (p)ppGpp synthetase/guanosine-3',5'-bis(diphosphate) 3'-pyrophosphohydrolase [Nevskia sp.]|nr:bifunctional (p)ppGpp synthetase/guanosine-3',5'-bis(diphosphate) 3'-pyrophosphohydrolase [Nevskia sp.]